MLIIILPLFKLLQCWFKLEGFDDIVSILMSNAITGDLTNKLGTFKAKLKVLKCSLSWQVYESEKYLGKKNDL